MFRYKIDVLKELSAKGYTAPRMRKEKILERQTMQNLRKGKITNGHKHDMYYIEVSTIRCNKIIPTDEEKIKYF